MSLGWDDELPAGFQDADIEMREFEAQAREANPDNDEFTCDDCKGIFDIEVSVRVGVDGLICSACAGES